MIERSCSKHIVLLGIGHTNAHIVRMWGMDPIADTDLTCITDNTVATYSGMLPAVLAGQIPQARMEIDLVRLCASVGARLITNRVTGIDQNRREVLFDDRPAVAFDALSIGIGSVPSVNGVTIDGESLIKIKPMQTFLPRLETQIKHALDLKNSAHADRNEPFRVVVVGSGVAGIEISFCLPPFLQKHLDRPHQLHLVTRSNDVLPDASQRTRRKVIDEIRRRKIQRTTGLGVTKVQLGHITLSDGLSIPADLVIWATGAVAPELLQDLGLPLDERGFIATDRTLKSKVRGPIFAVGDTGTIIDESLPKAGVYAVRQGPVLWENMHRILDGRQLQSYAPQRSFLKLINTGDGKAIGQWKGLAPKGRWVMRLKETIDGRFMDKYQVTASMSDGDEEMQCRGCGCKLGADALDMALAVAGRDGKAIPLEDAAAINDDGSLIASTDFFTSPFTDGYLSGRIAALHSASDIIATGGLPTHALGNVVLPEGDELTQQRMLADFLAGAREEFSAMGANIVGGHTIVGPRMEAGFTVIGRTEQRMLRKANLRAGDVLCLTKPLGIGVLLAAHMRSQCRADDYEAVIGAMLARQHPFVTVAKNCEISAVTDVTGFGLAGHLIEMLRESNLSAEISLEQVPLLADVESYVDQGIESTLAPANRRFERWIAASSEVQQHVRYKILFDPQTCGGLLFAISPGQMDRVAQQLSEVGLDPPFRFGTVHADHEDGKCLSVATAGQ